MYILTTAKGAVIICTDQTGLTFWDKSESPDSSRLGSGPTPGCGVSDISKP